MNRLVPVFFLFFLLISSFFAFAQEENATAAKEGTRYIDLKIKSLDKYNSRIERQQDHLLKKLKRKEKHFAHKLKNSDSLAYAKYQQQGLSYDSISKISKSDTDSTAANFSKKKNPTVDSLRGVQSFVQNKSGLSSNTPEVQNKNAELNQMQGKLNFRNYINQLITQRTNNLNKLGDQNENVPGLTDIQKQVYYTKSRMKVFKDMEEEPTTAEDKAMEYLQGTNGFDKYMKSATGGSSGMQSLTNVASGSSSSDLQKMGFQTKQQLQSGLQKKFGASLGIFGKNATAGLKQFQDQTKDIAGNAKDTKQSLNGLKNTGKPSFKVNPMRGLPFWKRIEKRYSFQTTHASSTGSTPAIFEPSFMCGFKHTLRLTYGLGIAGALGLGESWQNIHFSYQGVGLRSFATWQWQYGLGVYTGYERMYKRFVFNTKEQGSSTEILSVHNNASYNESLLIGLTKSYHLNKKYNGSIQLLYDIWWQQKGLQSPLVLRFETIKK